MSEAISTVKVLLPADPVSAVEDAGTAAVSDLSRSSSVAMAGGLLSQGLKFLVIIYIARGLSVSEFGLVSFAIAASGYTLTLSNFGLPVFGSRAVAMSGTITRGLLGEIVCLRAVLAILGTLATIGILSCVPNLTRIELLLVGIFCLSNVGLAGLFDWVFQGLHRQEISAVLNILCQGGWFALTVVGIQLGFSVLAVPLALCGAALLASGVGYCWLLGTTEIRNGHNDHLNVLRRSREILRLAGPLGWGTLLVTVLIWSDAIIVRLLRGEQAVGLYAAGNRAALALAMLSNFYVQGAFPLLSRASQTGLPTLTSYFQRCYEDMALVFLPGSIWAIFYARDIILLVFKNPDYVGAVPVFRVFQITFLITALSNLFGIGALVATHRDKDYRKVLLMSTIVFLPLCVLMTIWAGNFGASLAALLAQVCSLLFFLRETRGRVQPSHVKALWTPMLAGLVAGTVSKWAGLNVFWSAAFLMLIYAGAFSLHGRMPSLRQAAS